MWFYTHIYNERRASHWADLFTTGRGRNTAACGKVKVGRDTAGGLRPGMDVALGRRRA